jgi:hypothetical protein
MPLIRCDYSKEHFNDEQLTRLNKVVFDVSANLCKYNTEDAQNKISIFNKPYGPIDHSTASAEIEVRAKKAEFEQSNTTPNEVRAAWLKQYESVLIPLAQEINLDAPIILTVTFEDWEVIVVSAGGSVPNQ